MHKYIANIYSREDIIFFSFMLDMFLAMNTSFKSYVI